MARSHCAGCTRRASAPWIDSVSREMLETGEARPPDEEEDAIVGVTRSRRSSRRRSPRASGMTSSSARLKTEDDPTEIFLQLAMEDIRRACDLMRPIWDGRGEDGYVSLEVDPTLAYDRRRPSSRRSGAARGGRRPNLFVKIPATVPPRRDRGLHREGQVDQRDADLLARALRRRSRRRTSAGSSASSPRAGDPTKSRPWRASSSRASTPRRTGAWTSSAARRRGSRRARSRTPARLPALAGAFAGRAGSSSPPRARARSAASGRRRRRRTPSTGT